MPSTIAVVRAGRQPYLPTWELQRRLARARRADVVGDLLLLLEHPPTYTIGRGGSRGNLLIDQRQLAAVGAECLDIDRGGDITFHGPGQLVAYLIRDLRGAERRVRHYVWQLEETAIRAISGFGVTGERSAVNPGVWVGRDKIAALGIAVSRGVAYHGFALNVTTDLRFFDYMIPCGIRGYGATSLERELGRAVPMTTAVERVVAAVSDVFAVEIVDGPTIERLRAANITPERDAVDIAVD